jgi:hypothetical protein
MASAAIRVLDKTFSCYPWERKRLACFQSGLEARAPRRYTLAKDA